jgi:outer membrane protein insertion porin family
LAQHLTRFLAARVWGSVLILGLGVSSSAWAKTKKPAPVVKPVEVISRIDKITVRGNKKIEADAISAKITSKVGQNLDAEAVHKDVQELFKLGYFYDILVSKENDGKGGIELIYQVVEKPSVIEIVYEGNSEIKDDDLAEAAAIKPYEILDIAKVREAVEKIEKLYEDKGYFLARVEYSLENMNDADSVRLKFKIQENDKVQVKRITFLGNDHLSSGKLKAAMITKENNLFSFISGSGSYKQEAFDHDIQLLQFLYFNEGYVQVKIDRPQVYVTPDKRSINITFRVEEGEQFHVGQIDFTGDLLFPKQELADSTVLKENDLFVYETLQKDIQNLTAKYGDLGYAFTNVIPRTHVREKEKLVDITFEFDKGTKVYIGKINVVGNFRTRDKVVRRELKIREGELYNETRKRESMALVKRLGYFEDVNFNQKTEKNDPTKVDIDIVVKERNTGTLQVGAGYSSFYGLIFNGQVSQINLFGKGQSLSVSIDFSKIQSLFKLSFTEPYFNDTRWSVGGDAYQSRRLLIPYSELKTGGDFRWRRIWTDLFSTNWIRRLWS